MSSQLVPPPVMLETTPMSPLESMFWRLEEMVPGAFRVAALITLDGCMKSEHLTEALRRLQMRHPKLRAAITPSGDRGFAYQFDETPPPIPFHIVDYEEEEAPWRETTRQLLHLHFPDAGPMAAVRVLRNRSKGCSHLLLTAHHAVADGLSAVTLLNDLLAGYAAAEAHQDETPEPGLPLIAARRAKTTGGWRRWWWMLRRVARIQYNDRRAPKTLLPEDYGVPQQTQWVHWVFSREETLRIVRRCRQERAALSGALQAAVFLALLECLGKSEAVFKCQFPFDVRSSLEVETGQVTDRDIGCFVSVMNQYYKVCSQSSFWDMARRAHQDQQDFIQFCGPETYYNISPVLLRLIPRGELKPKPPEARQVALFTSNYGVLNLRESYGSLRPRACTLLFRNDSVGPQLVTESLVLGQQLNVGFAAAGLEPAFWERLQAATRAHLLANGMAAKA